MKFTLTLNGKHGFVRQALYDPEDSSLVWTDNEEPLPLPQAFANHSHWALGANWPPTKLSSAMVPEQMESDMV